MPNTQQRNGPAKSRIWWEANALPSPSCFFAFELLLKELLCLVADQQINTKLVVCTVCYVVCVEFVCVVCVEFVFVCVCCLNVLFVEA